MPKKSAQNDAQNDTKQERTPSASSPWRRRNAAAEYLGVPPSWLERAAVNGTGPKYYKPDGTRFVFYRVEDLDAFVGEPVLSATEAHSRNKQMRTAA